MSSLNIIIVEDDTDLCTLITEELVRHQIQVTCVGSAQAFFKLISNNTYDIVILDLGLPDNTDLSIISKLRSTLPGSKMGVIILTGKGASDDRVNGYRLGADVYMVKPIDTQELAFAALNLFERLPSPLKKNQTDINKWRLDLSLWTLKSPTGKECQLSAKEVKILQEIYSNKTTATNKYDLGKALGYMDDEHGKRALESAILRFRRKLSTMGNVNVPIKTVHGIGYTFSDALIIT